MKTSYINKLMVLSFLLVLGGGLSRSYAQQDSQYTQYMYNTQLVNPAYAGNRGVLSFNGIFRSQWVGLDGAPETLSFSLNTPVSDRVGLGLSFFNDEIGPSVESNIAMDFSYVLPMNDKGLNLALGLKGGINVLNIDFDKLNIFDPGDPDFFENVENRISPIVGVGFFLHQDDKWYLGVSTPNLINTEHYDNSTSSTAEEEINGYLMGGYVFDLGINAKLKPAFLFKGVKGAPLTLDLSANFLFYERFILGAAYRYNNAVSGLAGFHIDHKVMIGYAYDHDTTELGNYNSGSHEFFIRFELPTRKRRTVNPRFF